MISLSKAIMQGKSHAALRTLTRNVRAAATSPGLRKFVTSARLYESARSGLVLGIVRETYDKWERRAPLAPHHVKELSEVSDVLVQPAAHRVFTDSEYKAAGAKICENLSQADVLLGVKQVKEWNLLPDKTYMFFSHVIKGQPENMPLLQSILDKNIHLFDYECIAEDVLATDSKKKMKKRLVAFGKYAGIAGMIDSFQALGRRLLASGYSTPFLNCPPSYMFHDLDEAKRGVRKMGEYIANFGLPPDLDPLIFAFTGTGNVTKGAREIFDLLPHKMISRSDLEAVRKSEGPHTCVYGIQVEQEDMVRRTTGDGKYDKAHYRENPHEYESIFHETIAPSCNVLVNGVYWDERYPRVLSKEQMKELYLSGNKSLYTVADISCDVNGSVEFLEQTTSVEKPYFLYDPLNDQVSDNITSDGVAVMGVDILPTELPREATEHFGEALSPLLKQLLTGTHQERKTFEEASNVLPKELANACIAYGGSLTPDFEYIKPLMNRSHGPVTAISDPHLLISIKGHLFDSGLINQVLDAIEGQECHFDFEECNVKRRVEGKPEKSSVLLRVSSKCSDSLDKVISKVSTLVDLIETAEATMQHYDSRVETKAPSRTTGATVTSQEEQKVLILGAGRVAGSLAEYLGRTTRRDITVASQLEDEAASVAKQAKRGKAVVMDAANDKDQLSRLVDDADVVVSLLPAPMHPPVAEQCINKKTDLVTASYLSDEIRALENRCEEAGITILNEVGLDPGMDHMSAMKIIDDIKARGGEVVHFSSVCGGLPAPEAANNPLMYKFSWSPMGVIRASQNSAVYRSDGQIINVDGDELLANAKNFDAWPSLHLECLPNRDSLVYGDTYGIQSADTIFRGTLRYNGFSSIMNVYKNMGLFNDSPAGGETWGDVLNQLKAWEGSADKQGFLLHCAGGNEAVASRAASCLKWLGVRGEQKVSQPDSILRSFCDVLEEQLQFEEHERDMVLMHHDIQAAFDDGSRETHHSSLQLFGDEKMTAMCKTVGYTAAVGTDLLLSGQLGRKGLLLPTSKDIYDPCLDALEREGLHFEEKVFVNDEEEAI